MLFLHQKANLKSFDFFDVEEVAKHFMEYFAVTRIKNRDLPKRILYSTHHLKARSIFSERIEIGFMQFSKKPYVAHVKFALKRPKH